MAILGNKSGKFERWVLAAELLIAAAICYVLVRLVITLINPQSVWISPPITTVKPSAVQTAGRPVFNAGFDAFNRDVINDSGDHIQALPQMEIGQDAPETNLNLVLVGKRYATEQATAGAIIQTPDNQQKTFYIGQEVISGVVLESVSRDFVVLSTQGRLERLSLERNEPTMLTVEPSEVLPEPIISAPAVHNAPNMNSVLDAKSLSVEALMSAVSPVRKNGQISGYRITRSPDGVDLAAIGIKVGDVITQIGRTDLTGGLPNFTQLQNDYASGRMDSMQVLRSGQLVTVDLN